jgi:hypothetical protein
MPTKKRTPQMNDKKNPYLRPLLWIAKRRGKSPIQAKKPRSNLGKEITRRRDERKAKEKSIR